MGACIININTYLRVALTCYLFFLENSIYIFYVLNYTPHLAVAKLTPDGLGIADDKFPKVEIKNSWNPINSLWHFKCGKNDYVIFSENGGDGLRVAKSENGVLGPYEASSKLLMLGQDLRVLNVIIEEGKFYLAYGPHHGKVNIVTLKWKGDWPYKVEISLSNEERNDNVIDNYHCGRIY